MLKIYGIGLSSPVNKVRFVANALELSYEFVNVNIMAGETQTESYLKMHPAGKIPVIDDDGFILFESTAIAKYLIAKNNSDLYPSELKAIAIEDQWIDFGSSHIATAMGRVAFNRVLAPIINAPVDQQSLKDGLSFLDRFLPIVDTQLSQKKFLTGEKMSLADINLLSALDPAEAGEVDLSGYKNLKKWRENLMSQEFYTKCHKSYTDALETMKTSLQKA